MGGGTLALFRRVRSLIFATLGLALYPRDTDRRRRRPIPSVPDARDFSSHDPGLGDRLGGVGLFVIALLDSSFLSFPQVNDLLIIVLSTKYPGADAVLRGHDDARIAARLLHAVRRRAARRRSRSCASASRAAYVDRALTLYQRHGLLAVVVPALLPPPMPFKVFVLLAGAAAVSPWRFGAGDPHRPRHPLFRPGLSRGAVWRAGGRLDEGSTAPRSASASPCWPSCAGVAVVMLRQPERRTADAWSMSAASTRVHVDLVATANRGGAAARARICRIDVGRTRTTRMARLVFERDRRAFLITRALVRTMLSRYAPVAPRGLAHSSPTFTAGPRFCDRPTGVPDLRFNISHTDGLIACAVTIGREVGVDVEHIERRLTHDVPAASSRRTKSPTCARCRRTSSDAVFFDYWTLKEAYIKARGFGLALPLGDFAFKLQPPAPPAIAFEPALRGRSGDVAVRAGLADAAASAGLAVRRDRHGPAHSHSPGDRLRSTDEVLGDQRSARRLRREPARRRGAAAASG